MTRIAFIGLGRMGLPMAKNLIDAGFEVTGYDIDPARTDMLVNMGGSPAATMEEAVTAADLALSIIMNDAILGRVALGAEGVISNLATGAIYCDLSTVSPAASAEVRNAAASKSVRYLCAKVAGSIDLAESGGLTLFASGREDDFEAARPAFSAIAARVHHVGSDDSAAYLKLVHSLIVGVYSSMIGEALAFGERGGLDLAMMVDILEAGPLGSRQLTLKAPIIKERAFGSPPSDIDTAAKDVDLILETARHDCMALPLTSTARQMMAASQATGHGKLDIYSVIETFERLSGVSRT